MSDEIKKEEKDGKKIGTKKKETKKKAEKEEAPKPEKEENIHKDHRSRMYDRFIREGFDHFEPHQIVEFLLFFSIPRRDTNPAAHRLVNKFGGVAYVLEAEPEEMVEVEGIGEKSAELFSLLRVMDEKYLESKEDMSACLKNRREVLERMTEFLTDEPDGTFCVLFFTNMVEILDVKKYDRETIGFPFPDNRIIVQEAMLQNAGSIATGRKCSGKITFSAKEKEAFRNLDYMLRRLDMCLVDHFAVNETGGMACFGQKELDFAFFTEA